MASWQRKTLVKFKLKAFFITQLSPNIPISEKGQKCGSQARSKELGSLVLEKIMRFCEFFREKLELSQDFKRSSMFGAIAIFKAKILPGNPQVPIR